MRINTNLTAMNTYTQYTKNNNKIASSVEKLSSGLSINSAADNAAGLAISEKMRAQIRGLQKASTNSQDAISLVQTAEGSLAESTEILQRMRELAVQSSSDTNEDQIDRTALQDEFSQLQAELDDIAKNTTFNKKNLLDGSLASTTKNLTNTSLANSGMTVELGNADAGSYNFSVSTKLESAAVAGKQPTSCELVTDGAASYFNNTALADGNTVTLGANAAESSLLNGNYTLSASYGTDNTITVTATGDNGQTFEAKINQVTLETLDTATGADLKVDLTFNSDADDAFNVSLGLTSNLASTENNYNTLAENISMLTVSVSGGVTAQEAEYGVYANLTGAESVKLESGMSSVSFDNGVKVNFDTLTASSVDPENNAALDATGTVVTNPTAASTLAAVTGTIGGQVVTGASWDLSDGNGIIAAGDYTITSDVTGALTLTDAANNVFTAAKQATTAAASTTATYTFTNTADGSVTFDGALTLTAGAAFAVADITFTDSMTGSAAYALTGEATGSATMGNFIIADDSTVSNGSLSISSEVDGTNTVFTATDAAGTEYTATVATSDMASATSGGSVTNTLAFNSATGATGFSVDLTTTNALLVGTTFTDGAQLTTTVENAGHNYAKTFSASATALDASTASSFSVEASANDGLTFQVGANEGDEMNINIDKMDANYLGVASASVGTQSAAAASIGAVDSAINQVSSQRAYLGAIQNRLDHKIANLDTSAENLTSAESLIRDVDMAKEMTKFTNANILQQAATAMLAQANSLPQNVLSLIG